MRDITLSKILFWLLVILLPINLGLHFIIPQAYVTGLLIDYLIPTIYVQDIICFLILICWFMEERKDLKSIGRKLSLAPAFKFIIWFLFIAFLSTLIAQRFVPSFIAFLRLCLYVGVCLYTFTHVSIKHKPDFKKLRNIFLFQTLFLSIFGIFQFYNQGALFNNYKFLGLGEQPYTASTVGIAKENVLGSVVIPSYGLFSHPNVFGGFLSLILMWVFILPLSTFSITVFLMGIFALLFTFSYFSYAAFLLGMGMRVISKKFPKVMPVGVAVIIMIAIFSFLLPLFNQINSLRANTSFYRRSDLITSSFNLIQNNALFGYGYNLSTVFIEKYLPDSKDIRFVQPPHNIFVLFGIEVGLIGTILFILILITAMRTAYKRSPLLFVLLLQILFLASFDHYFSTIHQTQLLFWLLIGLAL